MNTTVRYILASAGVGLCVAIYFAYASGDSVVVEKPAAGERLMATGSSRPGRSAAMGWPDSPFGQGGSVDPNPIDANEVVPKADSVLGRSGRPVDFGGLTAQKFIAKWSVLARTGDKDAAYKTYQAESVCANNDEPVPAYEDAAEREQFLHERERLKTLCQGVTPAQVQERLHFLADAAHAGNVDARIDFYIEGPYGRSINLAANRSDPIVQQWKAEAVTNLKAAAEAGEPFALALLSQAYYAGELVPRDAGMSLAYTVAEATVRNVDLSQTQLHRRFGAQMSDTDFQNALQLGIQIAHECCKK